MTFQALNSIKYVLLKIFFAACSKLAIMQTVDFEHRKCWTRVNISDNR